MKPKIDGRVIDNIAFLLSEINSASEKNRKAYLNIRLYLLLTYIQNNYPGSIPSTISKIEIKQLFSKCVNELTDYFKCDPNTLPNRIIGTVGKEVEPYFISDDKTRISDSLLYFSRNEAAAFKTIIREGCLHYQTADKSHSFDMSSSSEEREFVLSFSGDLYVLDKARKNAISPKLDMRHSSFLSGGEVLSAGMVKIKNNQITEISNESGHYRPSHKDIALLVNHLDMLGVNISKIKINLVFPKLSIRADAFLTNYQELLKGNEQSFGFYESIRKKAQHITMAQDLFNNPTKELQEIISVFEQEKVRIKETVNSKYVEMKKNLDPSSLVTLNGKIREEIETQTAVTFANLWVNQYKDSLSHVNSTALLLVLTNDPNFSKKEFDEILLAHELPLLDEMLDMEVDKKIKGETISADPNKFNDANIEEQLIALKGYIQTKTWHTFFRSAFFNDKNVYPDNVERMVKKINSFLQGGVDAKTAYYDILELARDAAENPSWTRTHDTQKFYDKIRHHGLLELTAEFTVKNQIEPSPKL